MTAMRPNSNPAPLIGSLLRLSDRGGLRRLWVVEQKSLLSFWLAVVVLIALVTAAAVPAAPVASSNTLDQEQYHQAEACRAELLQDKQLQQYRGRWLACIELFETIYRQNYAGAWAAASLFQSGRLYQELWQRSGWVSDKKEARDIFERLIKRYPKSAYRTKAEAAIRRFAQPLQAAKQTTTTPPAQAESPKPKPKPVSTKIPDKAPESVKRTTGTKKTAPKPKPSPTKKPPAPAKKVPASTAQPTDSAAREKYARADACYSALQKNRARQRYRDQWENCIARYQAVVDHNPKGPWAPAGLFMAGKLYRELYHQSKRVADLETARELFGQLSDRYPESRYNSQALAQIEEISANDNLPPHKKNRFKKPALAATTKTETGPDPIAAAIKSASSPPAASAKSAPPKAKPSKSSGDKKPVAAASPPRADSPAKAKPAPADGSTVVVTGLRYWSNPHYTRVVVDASNETTFTHRLLNKDPAINKPQRLFIDVDKGRLGEHTQKEIPIHDNMLIDARAAQYQPDAVRVVIDIKTFKTYKIFSLKNPFRIVVDVWGDKNGKQAPAGKPKVAAKPAARRTKPPVKKDAKLTPGALAKQLALGVRRVVIDPGHGGKDYGAPGYLKGVHEKHVVLKLAKRLAKRIRKQLKCEVILTRTTDRYLTLEERTAIANTKNADLFISIHTNSHRDRRAIGIETYFLNLATDDEAIRVAAYENATSEKNISDLQTILNDLMQNAKINESSRLATHVQKSLVRSLNKHYSKIKNKGVKQAPFYVLLGAQMPAILVEASFISNPRECKRLVNTHYQDKICDGIIAGIQKYMKETKPLAFRRKKAEAPG